MSEISYLDSPDLLLEPLTNLLESVAAESDDALPNFRRWCEAHVALIEAIAYGHDYPPVANSGVLSFEEVLVFVRMQLERLDAVRSTTGLSETEERRYEGLRAMELDLIARTSRQG